MDNVESAELQGDEASRKLTEDLILQDEIEAIQNSETIKDGKNQENNFQENERIAEERGRVGDIISHCIDPEIYKRDQRNREIKFNIIGRAREIIEHKMEEYYKLRRKLGVENFQFYKEGKKVSFKYLGKDISITWKGGKNFEWEGGSFSEIEEGLLTQLGIRIVQEDHFGNKRYSVPEDVSCNLGLSAEKYCMSIEKDFKTGVFFGILVKESDMDEYRNISHPGDDLTFGGLLASVQSERKKRDSLEFRVSDIFYELYNASKN